MTILESYHERLKEVVRQSISELASNPETTVQDLLEIQNLATDFAFMKKYPAVAAERNDSAASVQSNS